MRKKAGWRGLFACLAITAFVLGGCGKAAGETETQAVSMKEEQPGADEAAQEAGNEGEVCLPPVPDEILRQFFGRHRVFLDIVETAPVHEPGRAVDAGIHLRPLAQAEVESNEEKTGTDPSDANHEMEPADQNMKPFDGEIQHVRSAT